MSHASEPSMLALWAVFAIAAIGGLIFLTVFGSIWLETYREEVAGTNDG